MKGNLAIATLMAFTANAAFGQAKPADKPKPKESEVTTVKSETKSVKSPWNLTSELWSIDDAVPLATGQFDLRLTTRWYPETGDDEDDSLIFQPSVVWGVAENWELSANVPIYLGDGGDRGIYEDGNYDTNLGALWRLTDQSGYWPAFALGGTLRVPTGSGSSGIDFELRGLLTNEYDSGLRSHVNGFLKTANGNNTPGERDFQYGLGAGMDGPLFGKDHVRWVADYLYRISKLEGEGSGHLADVGWEWKMSDVHKLGMAAHVSLDHAADDVPDYGFSLTWAITLAQ